MKKTFNYQIILFLKIQMILNPVPPFPSVTLPVRDPRTKTGWCRTERFGPDSRTGPGPAKF